MCEGPDFYTFDTTAKYMSSECLACNKTVFSCKGGGQIEANEGYQRLVAKEDIFVKCGHLGGTELCLDGN